jgi:hypothetical protein
MILHIFKKDLRQLALLATLVTVAQLGNAGLWLALGNFAEPRGLIVTAYSLSGATLLGIAMLIASAVQLDALPGVTQDWLVRPIRRGDLLAAKFLFVLVVIHGPMLLADFAHGAAAGFAVSESLGAALSRSVYLFLILDLPVLALASVTRTLVQVGAGMLGIWIAILMGVAIGVIARSGAPPVFAATGLQWMTPAFWSLLAVMAGLWIVPMQYFRRATSRARVIAAGAVLLAPVLSYSRWAPAFATQQVLSDDQAAAEPLTIAFDPAIGRSADPRPATSAVEVLLPVRVAGLGNDSIVLNDRANVRLVDRDGTTLYEGRTTPTLGYGDDFPVRTAAAQDVRTHQRIVLPAGVYDRARDQPVRLELDYSLTLLGVEAAATIPAKRGSGRSATFGACETKVDGDGDGVALGCVRPGASPSCITATLVNPKRGTRNPENIFCAPDYTPFRARLFPDGVSQFGGEIKFRDLQGLAQFPVDGAQLDDAFVTLVAYRPIAHFTRRLDVPELRLADWVGRDAPAER